MGVRIAFDPRVVKLMEEFFRGKVCYKCGAKAVRYLKAKFFCHQCIPKRATYVEVTQAKDTRGRERRDLP